MIELSKWAKDRNIHLLKDSNKPNLITFYVSSDNECIQVVIEPKSTEHAIDIWSVETFDDREFHTSHMFMNDSVYHELDGLLLRINEWFINKDIVL